jgi:enamine deaminase RidA (YjgF/YER057c/UK114 family)
MPRGAVTSATIARPVGPFSPAVECDGSVYVSGQDLSDVLRVGVFLTNMADFQAMNAAYARHFEAPYPARTTVGVSALPLGARVEMDFLAR